MKRKKRRCGLRQRNNSSTLAPNKHKYQAHFNADQEKIAEILNPPHDQDEPNSAEQDAFSAHCKAVIQLFLVGCVALVFCAWTAVGLHEQMTSGNCSLLLGDAAPATLFIALVRHFLLK